MKKMPKKIVGLGQCSLDYIALVEDYPAEDIKEEVLEWKIEGGGPVATALVTAARLGLETAFIGIVASDKTGRSIRSGLKDEGVNTRSLKKRAGGKSQTAFIVVSPKKASRTIFWQRPTVAELRPEEVSRSLIESADLLMLDGLMGAASIHAAQIARRSSIPVLYDAGNVRDSTPELLNLSDYIVASERFAKKYAGTPARALQKLSKPGAKAITITLGSRGSITWCNGEKFKTPAYKVGAIDTTGAGDVFHGAFAYGVLNGYPIKKTIDFASAAAAIKCRKPGGRSGVAGIRETLKFIRKAKERTNKL